MKLKLTPIFIASVVVASIVGLGGIAKIAGVPQVHLGFQQLGLPGWFGYFIGICEVLGAIALFIRPLSALAAGGLVIIMVGAIYHHVLHTPLMQGIPALLVMVLSIWIFLQRRPFLLKFGAE
jgi:putative oxidoreductase